MTLDPFNLLIPLTGGKTLTVNTVSNIIERAHPAPGTPIESGTPAESDPPTDSKPDLEGMRAQYKKACSQARPDLPLVGVLSGELSPEQAAAAFNALGQIPRQLGMGQPPLIYLFGQKKLPLTQVLDFCLRECARSGWPARLIMGSRFPDTVLKLLETLAVEEVTVSIPDPGHADQDSHRQEVLTAVDRLLYNSPVRIRLEVPVTSPDPAFLSDLADHIIGRQWYMTPHFKAVLTPEQKFHPSVQPPFEPEHLNKLLEMMTAMPKLEVFDLSGWDSSQAVRQCVHTGSFPSLEERARDIWSSPLVFTPQGKIFPGIAPHHPASKPAGEYWPAFEFAPDRYEAWLEQVPILLDHCRNCFLMPVGVRGCRHRMTASDNSFECCQWARDLFIQSLLRAEAQGDLP